MLQTVGAFESSNRLLAAMVVFPSDLKARIGHYVKLLFVFAYLRPARQYEGSTAAPTTATYAAPHCMRRPRAASFALDAVSVLSGPPPPMAPVEEFVSSGAGPAAASIAIVTTVTWATRSDTSGAPRSPRRHNLGRWRWGRSDAVSGGGGANSSCVPTGCSGSALRHCRCGGAGGGIAKDPIFLLTNPPPHALPARPACTISWGAPRSGEHNKGYTKHRRLTQRGNNAVRCAQCR